MSSTHPTSSDLQTVPPLSERIGVVVERISRGFALAGGFMLLALIVMSLISIIGRKLYSSPIQGDMELIEIGSAIAIAAFLPFAEIRGVHIKADAFTLWASNNLKRRLDIFSHILLFLLTGLLIWRTYLQMSDYYLYGDSSVLLAIPMWIPLLFILPSLVLLAICAFTQALILLQRGPQ